MAQIADIMDAATDEYITDPRGQIARKLRDNVLISLDFIHKCVKRGQIEVKRRKPVVSIVVAAMRGATATLSGTGVFQEHQMIANRPPTTAELASILDRADLIRTALGNQAALPVAAEITTPGGTGAPDRGPPTDQRALHNTEHETLKPLLTVGGHELASPSCRSGPGTTVVTDVANAFLERLDAGEVEQGPDEGYKRVKSCAVPRIEVMGDGGDDRPTERALTKREARLLRPAIPEEAVDPLPPNQFRDDSVE